MDVNDVRKTVVITKSSLFDWAIMPFGMKNANRNFFRMMKEVFRTYMDKFLKVFVDDLNVHSLTWEEHLKHLLLSICAHEVKGSKPKI
jgi:hypothetical protein